MKVDFSTEFKLTDGHVARTFYDSLIVEIAETRGRRSKESLELRDEIIAYRCQSPDVTAAQASINTFFSWFTMLERIFEII